METSVKIAQNFLNEHGSMPYIMVVAESAKGDTYTWVGNFRKDKLDDDQKTFCGLMRTAFLVNDITSYTCLINAMMRFDNDWEAKNVMVATNVTSEARSAKIYEIKSAIELQEVMAIEPTDYLEGMYFELLPTQKEEVAENVVKGINTYLSTIAYNPPSLDEVVVTSQDGLAFLLENGLD